MRVVRLAPPAAAPLSQLLTPYGVEFPCGGAGVCRGCRVRVVEGTLAVTAEMEQCLTREELAEGWRLACCAETAGPVVLEVAQWEASILADETPFPFMPREGRGIAVDIGTTTLAAQLVDLATGEVLAVETALNPQAAHGSDLMSRVAFAMDDDRLTGLIREAVNGMVAKLGGADVVTLVGNSVMQHIFCARDVTPFASAPFEAPDPGEAVFRAGELGWSGETRFLESIGGFVGSDILAGIHACGMPGRDELTALIDLGTNGEIVVGNRDRMLCASTAAGPAFEAGRIRMGMRATAGAIAHVHASEGRLQCDVIGDEEPHGVCGSGLIESVAAALELGLLQPSGRLANGAKSLPLMGGVFLSQGDIRELQLAKAAIAAGLRILLGQLDARFEDVTRLYLAGAFGNYVDIGAARRIGLIEVDAGRVQAAGNTALRGAKMALFEELPKIAVAHVPLASDPRFEDLFTDCLAFPE
jgi:uncharacterized 2Fe-2S/4Fe-4S cluster protein (DUF4445 family)